MHSLNEKAIYLPSPTDFKAWQNIYVAFFPYVPMYLMKLFDVIIPLYI